MLITWMAYAAAFATIVAGGALALDHVAQIWGAPRRAVWMAALFVATLVPVVLAVRPAPTTSSVVAIEREMRIEQQTPIVRIGGRPTLAPPTLAKRLTNAVSRVPSRYAASWNQFSAASWLAASMFLFALLVRGAGIVRRHRTTWRETNIDGRAIVITDDVGPAVVGVLRPRILLPTWVLSLDASARELMLRHEAEHIRARDPLSLFVGAVAIALCPWNPAVWFIVQRLRLAIEIDCDHRVLRHADAGAHEYGMLLLTVGARSASALRFTASLAEPRRFLERRILAMTNRRPNRPFIATMPFVAIALIAVAAAAQTPRPVPVVAPRAPSAPSVAPIGVVAPAPLAATPTPVSTPVAAAAIVRAAPVGVAPLAAPASPVVAPAAPAPPVAPVVAESMPIPIEVLRAWIQREHPGVISGTAGVNRVTIIVDSKGQFVASVVDSLSREATAAIDTAMIAVALHGVASEAANLVLTKAQKARAAGASSPVYIIDGVRVNDIDSLDTDAVQSVQVLHGSSASVYVGDTTSVEVVVTTKPHDPKQLLKLAIDPNPERLAKIGIRPERVDDVQVMSSRPGVVGPNRLYIAVLQLKPDGE